jgi:YecR-like lipoprotein
MKQIIFLIIFCTTFFSGCTVVKTLSLVDGSKSSATLTFAYEYYDWENVKLESQQAQAEALSRCKSWGFSNSNFFPSGESTCLEYNGYGACIRYRVTYKCQCVD